MNISKNLLSLGLIAVISGISTAQTYTATAGTNGITDIQSDYSMSTGDGANVSVDVPLEFELPKKVMLALRGEDNSISSIIPTNSNTTYEFASRFSTVLSGEPRGYTAAPTASNESVTVNGSIYTNTDIIINGTISDFVHETDPNSILIASTLACDHGVLYANYHIDAGNRSVCFANHSISANQLINNNGVLDFNGGVWVDVDSIDPTDRAGKYLSTATITVSTL